MLTDRGALLLQQEFPYTARIELETKMPEAGTRLNQKLDRIRGGNYRTRDFIIADAKDGDMGGGAGAMVE